MDFKAIAFDLDGTLYPNHRFHLRLLPFLARKTGLLLAMGRARDAMRAQGLGGDFYAIQASLAAKDLGMEPEKVRELFQTYIYDGWEPHFERVRLHNGVLSLLKRCRDHGLKLGILSDFPLRTKLARMGLGGLWDVEICSEEVGYLKPAPQAFLALAQGLKQAPKDILYVGNSFAFDIEGAQGVGMRAALIAPPWKRGRGEDFGFSHFKELESWLWPSDS